MNISFNVKPLYVEEGSTSFGRWTLRRFQEKVLDTVSKRKDTLLVAPTGSGKTLSLMLGEYGFVGVYPNNTLLLDQQRSLHRILTGALEAEVASRHTTPDGIDVMRVYKLPSRGTGELPVSGFKKVTVVLLSGRYIGYEYDDNGSLIPKRVTILRNIVDKICYSSRGESMPYIVTLSTPDTALMIMAGIYRDFEKVGYTLHDFLLASAEGYVNVEYLLSKHKVALVSELGDIDEIRHCLLKYPWFIDEFHLYGTYEAYGLLPVLKVYRDYAGWEEPFVLSSATPKGTLYEMVAGKYRLSEISEKGRDRGDETTLVRGETQVEVAGVQVNGRGISKWFRVGYYIDSIIDTKINEIKNVISEGGHVFIVVDRVNQVPRVVDVLVDYGIKPECSVSIKPSNCLDSEELVLVGSESISQGIDRSNVKYGIITAYNWASLLQRFGRIGRKTSSKIIIAAPLMKESIPLEGLDGSRVTYSEFSSAVVEEFPSIDPSRVNETVSYKEVMENRSRLIEYASVIAYAQVSKVAGTLKALVDLAGSDAIEMLGLFYGPPEAITRVMMFRSTGFQVIVEKPDGEREETDIVTVLRNYSVKKATLANIEWNRVRKSIVKLDISLEPKRLKLVLKRNPAIRTPVREVKENTVEHLAGKITTIGELVKLGYELVIKSWDDVAYEIKIPMAPNVKEQTIILLQLPEELVKAYAYTLTGIEVVIGERSLIGILL